MIFLILDVHYQTDVVQKLDSAKVAGIRFQGIEINEILSEHTVNVNNVAPYESGQFYKREMPCLLALINQIKEPFDVIIIDGYVFLDSVGKAGLGKYLYDNLANKKPIIGIAKNHFYDITEDYAVWRGISKRPLYVTSIGINITTAKEMVSKMEGEHRIPKMAADVDKLGRVIN
ncbi:endonuclease V [Psychrobacter immobilis]|uniref:endonuclease V n=1 Tax=Psychrobacter immobilis TaxID=498 RepID=UPI001918A1C2|nr:endonuclease V [Psychrobacter immobilis]